MKILITGAKGMLGSDFVSAFLEKKHEVIARGRDLDITDKSSIQEITLIKPELIINCAAYTNVDLAETDKDLCYKLNVIGVDNLVTAANSCGSILVHFSTDYVFDGAKSSFNEDDAPHPLNYYGETKALGEECLRKKAKKYYLVRTSWLFGKNGKNFVETIKKLSSEKETLKVVNDQIGRPTFTKDLVEGVMNLVFGKKEFGVYHLTNSGSCSWFDLAKKIVSLTNSKCIVSPCTTEEFPRPAKRPKFSVLNNNKFSQLRSWESALSEYLGVD
jgi:dTDP-4-dehydrorhamnose reductase